MKETFTRIWFTLYQEGRRKDLQYHHKFEQMVHIKVKIL